MYNLITILAKVLKALKMNQSVFNTCTDPHCKYCGSYDLTETSENLTCRDCGAEQGIQIFVVGYDTYNQIEPYFSVAQPDSKTVQKNKSDSQHFLESIQSKLNIPDSVVDTALNMLREYVQVKETAIRQKDIPRMCLAAAYYASRNTQIPLTRKSIVDFHFVCPDDFSKACSDLKAVLGYNVHWSSFFVKTYDSIKEIAAISPILQGLKLSKENAKLLRSKINKIYEKIKGNQHILSHHPTTLAASLVYTAAKAAKMDCVSMTLVSKSANVTMASIITIQKRLIDILTASSSSK